MQSSREQGIPFAPTEQRGRSFGSLSSFSDPSLIALADSAFEKAMVEEYAAR